MANEAHTPGPWEFGNDSNGFWIEARGVQIATISHEKDNAGLTDGESEANARRIVQCVNAHDTLIAALERIFDEAHVDGRRDRGPRRMSPGLRDAIYASRDAIRRATGAAQ